MTGMISLDAASGHLMMVLGNWQAHAGARQEDRWISDRRVEAECRLL